MLAFFFFFRNLSHCITKADRRQVCTRRVSWQQRGGHQCPSYHRWAERQQIPVLPEPVTLLFPRSTLLLPLFLSHSSLLCCVLCNRCCSSSVYSCWIENSPQSCDVLDNIPIFFFFFFFCPYLIFFVCVFSFFFLLSHLNSCYLMN